MIVIAAFLAQDLVAGPPRVTAEDALATYRRLTTTEDRRPARCPDGSGTDIVVCAPRGPARFRLSLPDQRFAPGEVVRHPSEPPATTNAFRGGPQEPSRQGETVAKIIGLLKSAVTGEDRGF